MLSQLIIIFNNSIKYNFTHLAFIKILYKFKIKKLLDLRDIEDLKLNNFIKTFFDIASPSFPPVIIMISIIE